MRLVFEVSPARVGSTYIEPPGGRPGGEGLYGSRLCFFNDFDRFPQRRHERFRRSQGLFGQLKFGHQHPVFIHHDQSIALFHDDSFFCAIFDEFRCNRMEAMLSGLYPRSKQLCVRRSRPCCENAAGGLFPHPVGAPDEC